MLPSDAVAAHSVAHRTLDQVQLDEFVLAANWTVEEGVQVPGSFYGFQSHLLLILLVVLNLLLHAGEGNLQYISYKDAPEGLFDYSPKVPLE